MGDFGLFSPYIEGSYKNVPIWVNVLITVFLISVVGLALRSLWYSLEITDAGVTQRSICSWTVKWQEIQGWGYSLDTDGNYLFLELIPGNKRKTVLSGFLDKKNLPMIKAELEQRLGKPTQE
jgi:hypothetical protein